MTMMIDRLLEVITIIKTIVKIIAKILYLI